MRGGNALPALVSAALWGMADFCGGMGVRLAGGTARSALRFVLVSHGFGLTVLAFVLLERGQALPALPLLRWGVAAGVAGGLALVCFYVALSRGAMGASAAISGLLAAALPAAVSGLTEGSPGWRHGVGFVIAGAAIWLIAAGERASEERVTVLLAVLAGIGFGLYFIALRFAGPAGAVVSMAAARCGSLVVCSLVLLALHAVGVGGGAGGVRRKMLVWAAGTALLDTTGSMLFILATRTGRLDVAAVLASLYPASTILLAAGVLRELPSRRQGWGMAVAIVAVVLIAG